MLCYMLCYVMLCFVMLCYPVMYFDLNFTEMLILLILLICGSEGPLFQTSKDTARTCNIIHVVYMYKYWTEVLDIHYQRKL